GPDFGIDVVEQQHENRELLVGAGRNRALRREQAHVARHLASLEEIEKGSGSGHRTARYSRKLVGVSRAVTGSPALPSGFAGAPGSTAGKAASLAGADAAGGATACTAGASAAGGRA